MWVAIGIILFVLLLLAAFFIRGKFRTPWEAHGEMGERQVLHAVLRAVGKHNGYAYHNVAFKDLDGYSSEIDIFVICTGGVYAIEVKSNTGSIFGNHDEPRWRAQKRSGEMKDLENPLIQNKRHISHLRRMAGNTFPYITSLAVFPYADITLVRDADVLDLASLIELIRKSITEGRYEKSTVDLYNDQLQAFLGVYRITHEEHIETIRKHHES